MVYDLFPQSGIAVDYDKHYFIGPFDQQSLQNHAKLAPD